MTLSSSPMSPSSSVVVWHSGRLATRGNAPAPEFARDRWIGAALLVLSAVVFVLFVAVLEQDVRHSELQHAEQRARAVAQAECESSREATSRGACLALVNGDTVAAADATRTADATPPNTADGESGEPHLVNVSAMSPAVMAQSAQ